MDSNNTRRWIQIIVIQCATAQAAGTQYTKRLLPDFLIPYSPIRLDWVLEAERRRREDNASLEECCQVMGCLELRTVRKHLKRLHDLAGAVALDLSGQLAHSPQYKRLPEPNPEQVVMQRLLIIHDLHSQAAARAGHRAISLRHVLQVHWWHFYVKVSTSCVSRAFHPP